MATRVETSPTIFMRCPSSLLSHGRPIILPKVSATLDYEAEMVVVVGKRAKHLDVSNALSCIAGYSCANDGSIREFQGKTTQWDMGKNFDATGAFGPWMVTADDLPPGGKGLKIECQLNGMVMQSDNTANMIFPVAESIAYVTQGMTLEPGDIIMTGTPSGVGFARKPPIWMKAGDICEIEMRESASSQMLLQAKATQIGPSIRDVRGRSRLREQCRLFSYSRNWLVRRRANGSPQAHREVFSRKDRPSGTVTEMEPLPCYILIMNFSGSGLNLESHSSASITRR